MADQETTAPGFDEQRTGTGTREWAEFNLNIQIGCKHDCKYCYAKSNAARFKILPAGKPWNEEFLSRKAAMTSFPKKKGVVMFPTTHDIHPGNLADYLRIAKLVLEAGNQLLIVTKPHLAVVTSLCEALAAYRDRVLFRMTIGTTSEDVARFWEPGAPTPAERIDALRHAFQSSFNTSVSCEPLLGGVAEAQAVVEAVDPYATGAIWIGKLNQARRRVDISDPANLAAVEAIEHQQTDSEIRLLHQTLCGHAKVRFKDSITAVMARLGNPS